MGSVSREEESGQGICSSRIAKICDIHIKRFKHQGVAQDGKLLFPCADGLSNSSIFLDLHAAKWTPFSEEYNGKNFGSMGGDISNRRHDVHRAMLYIPHETTFTTRLKCVDVVRQTRTSIKNASQHTLNDYWNDEREVLLPGEWIGMNRFQILRMKLPEGYKLMNG